MQSLSICVNGISHFTNVICLSTAAWVFNACDHAKLTFFSRALHADSPPPFSYKLHMGKGAELQKE